MAQADSHNSTRRAFLSNAAGATAAVVSTKAIALPADDGALLELEEQIFEQHELATAHDDEMERLAAIWQPESERLYQEALLQEVQAGKYLTAQERWARVAVRPVVKAHTRLCRLQEVHFAKMGTLVKQMWAIPALTPEGRRAKVLVALCMLPDSWRVVDDEVDYGIREARQLLIELIGGEPGEQLRDQFA